jgi:hypothetical protein
MAWGAIVDCRASYDVVLNRIAEKYQYVDNLAVFGQYRILLDIIVQESLI